MKRNTIDAGLLLLRLTLGILMLFHGFAKLSGGVGGIQGHLAEHGLPGFIAYGAYIGEIVAPMLLIIGYRTKLAALVYAFNMLVAVLLVHSAELFTTEKSGGWAAELPGLYFFGALVLVLTGGGKYALSKKSKWD